MFKKNDFNNSCVHTKVSLSLELEQRTGLELDTFEVVEQSASQQVEEEEEHNRSVERLAEVVDNKQVEVDEQKLELRKLVEQVEESYRRVVELKLERFVLVLLVAVLMHFVVHWVMVIHYFH